MLYIICHILCIIYFILYIICHILYIHCHNCLHKGKVCAEGTPVALDDFQSTPLSDTAKDNNAFTVDDNKARARVDLPAGERFNPQTVKLTVSNAARVIIYRVPAGEETVRNVLVGKCCMPCFF